MIMYQDETHPPMLNELTKKLYTEGYTRESYPDYVVWSDWQNFGYKWEYALTLTWETPCGLLIEGDSAQGRGIACSDKFYNGVWYCAENNNPLVRCHNNGCKYAIPGIKIPHCPVHLSDRPYNYEGSFEQIDNKRIAAEKHLKKSVCKRGYVHCDNALCIRRNEPQEKPNVNIFYDIRRTWITRRGLIDDKNIEIEKSVKVFARPVTRSCAERWMKQRETGEFDPLIPKMTPEDRRQQYFTKMHRTYPGYDYFEFHYEVENVRIESIRAKRDLAQDLADIAEGITVTHASDNLKAAAQAKRDRRIKVKGKRIKRLERLMREVGYENLADIDKCRVDKAINKGEMEWVEKTPAPLKYKQAEIAFF